VPEEAHMRFEQLLDRKAVPLMGLLSCTEHMIQFFYQVMHLGCCLDRSADCDAHEGSLIELHRLFEFMRPVLRHRPIPCSVKGAIGISVLDPEALRSQ
jgi:hypothetical protein